MRRIARLAVVLFAALAGPIAPAPADALPADALPADAHWPQWRGPYGSGVARAGCDPPVEWSESKNVRWKVAVPGAGHATPIVWGDRLYLHTAVPASESAGEPPPPRGERAQRRGRERPSPPPHRFMVLALDRHSGQTVWQSVVAESAPHEPGHPDSSPASASPVTDGEHVYSYFGSRGLYCLDLTGAVVWSKDFGDMQTRRGFGEGASPALHGDTIVVVWDHEGDDFVVALDKRTGAQRWRTRRDEPTSWATPLIVERDGRAQVIVNATNRVCGYDLATGRLLWSASGMTENVIPTPVADDQRAYITSGFRGNALIAVRYHEARGDVTGPPGLAWKHDGKDTPYVPSPLLLDGRLYFTDNNRAILACLDAATGQRVFDTARIEQIHGVYASPVAAGGRVYIAGRDGNTAVLAGGPQFELLAVNRLDDGFDASPVVAGDALYLRGRAHLYCIAETSGVTDPASK